MVSPLLATKLYIPPVRSGLVPRPRLSERLDAGADAKLTLVSAAAGFGKTTLVAEWVNRTEIPCTWLSLDGGDNDPVQFLTYLIAALQAVDEEIGRTVEGLLGAHQLPSLEALITPIINDVAALPQPFLLVLDDVHVIHEEAITQAIEFLIEHQPPQLRLLLLTRQDPPLPLSRLRVRGQLVEIGEADLRFTAGEAGAFLEQALALDLEPEIVSTLKARTEGWIAGLQLAALSVRGKPGDAVAEFVSRFGGSNRHVIDYLAEEVLAMQREDVRDFLCQTSILDRLTASLCDAVTGRDDGQEMLRHLDGANLFLIPLDDRRAWYRYHRLFADFLLTELDETARSRLHARAADWFVAQGLHSEAVQHALASGDQDRAASTVVLASAGAFRQGSFATLQGWLDALPDEVVRGDHELATYQGWLGFFAGAPQKAAIYASAAERSLPPDATLASRGRLLSLQAHVALSHGQPDAAVQYGKEALARFDQEDFLFRNLTSNLLGQILEATGDVVACG